MVNITVATDIIKSVAVTSTTFSDSYMMSEIIKNFCAFMPKYFMIGASFMFIYWVMVAGAREFIKEIIVRKFSETTYKHGISLFETFALFSMALTLLIGFVQYGFKQSIIVWINLIVGNIIFFAHSFNKKKNKK